jgi:hypothetical protein
MNELKKNKKKTKQSSLFSSDFFFNYQFNLFISKADSENRKKIYI